MYSSAWLVPSPRFTVSTPSGFATMAAASSCTRGLVESWSKPL